MWTKTTLTPEQEHAFGQAIVKSAQHLAAEHDETMLAIIRESEAMADRPFELDLL